MAGLDSNPLGKNVEKHGEKPGKILQDLFQALAGFQGQIDIFALLLLLVFFGQQLKGVQAAFRKVTPWKRPL